MSKTTINISFEGYGYEFQFHKLNKIEATELKAAYESDPGNFLNMNLNGGEIFEKSFHSGSYGPSITDVTLTNDISGETIELDDIETEQTTLITGEEEQNSGYLDYFYIAEGKVFGNITINIPDGDSFDSSKLKINYLEFSLEGYPEQYGTIVESVLYDGVECDIETEDNGKDIYRCLLGYIMLEDEPEEVEDVVVVYDSNSQPEFDWSNLDAVF